MQATNTIDLFGLLDFEDPSTRLFLFDEIVEGKEGGSLSSYIILRSYGRSTKLELFRQFCRDWCLISVENWEMKVWARIPPHCNIRQTSSWPQHCRTATPQNR